MVLICQFWGLCCHWEQWLHILQSQNRLIFEIFGFSVYSRADSSAPVQFEDALFYCFLHLKEKYSLKTVSNNQIKWKKRMKDVALTIKRWTNVLLSCPTLCILLIAWASAAGFSNGSTRITCCASSRLRPFAPCCISISSTWTGCILETVFFTLSTFILLNSPLNWESAACDFLKMKWPSNKSFHYSEVRIMKLGVLPQ